MSGENLLKLFDRPTEPLFKPKGDDNTIFIVPTECLEDRFKPLQSELIKRFGTGKEVKVNKIELPDISLPLMLGRRACFSIFIPAHQRMAARLIEVFMGMKSVDDLLSAAVCLRDRVNPYMFVYAFSVAILHRPDTKNLQVPSLVETFPEKCIMGEVFDMARDESDIVPDGQKIILLIPRETASVLDMEHRLAYFREDLGVNVHHWHWHLIYPADGPLGIVDKDRRGELFYYMHHQIQARYNFERLCNGLGRVKRLLNWREPIAEGYFPKLDNLVANRVWPPRFANISLNDIDREIDDLKFDIQDLERWENTILSAIYRGSVVDEKGSIVELSETRGIDILGNLIEASILSINRNVYGNLHNDGHNAIGFCHDPEGKYLEAFGVMGDPATAMRDPVFYRWHAFIDDIFQKYKNTLPSYTVQQLDFPGIKISSIQVSCPAQTWLSTFWQQSDVNVSKGLDFKPRGPVLARFTHLQHKPFTYKIQVENSGSQKKGTVRIYLAPTLDEKALMPFHEHKNLFIELDKYTVDLKPGSNTLIRKSSESNVTIPFEQTLKNLQEGQPTPAALDKIYYCGCGWPQHMLIPKGSPKGFPTELFVMISNDNDDKVKNSESNEMCKDAASYCGIRDNKYPDRRSMGYPFDRKPRDEVDTLQKFLTPNMAVSRVIIVHTDNIVPRNQQQ